MKHLVYPYKTIAISLSLFLIVPQVAFANTFVESSNNSAGSHNSVNIENNTGGVSCINGKCTSNSGSSKTEYCYNGQCTTTDTGNVDYTSPDGNTHIKVDNNGDTNVTVSPEPTAGASDVSPSPNPSDTPDPSDTPEPTITPDPTITQMKNDINKHIRKEIDALKEHMKVQNGALDDMFKSLETMLNNMFK